MEFNENSYLLSAANHKQAVNFTTGNKPPNYNKTLTNGSARQEISILINLRLLELFVFFKLLSADFNKNIKNETFINYL